jgi:hypothetical protein
MKLVSRTNENTWAATAHLGIWFAPCLASAVLFVVARRNNLRYLKQEAAAATDAQISYLVFAGLLAALQELAKRVSSLETLGIAAALLFLWVVFSALIRAAINARRVFEGEPSVVKAPFRFLRRLA